MIHGVTLGRVVFVMLPVEPAALTCLADLCRGRRTGNLVLMSAELWILVSTAVLAVVAVGAAVIAVRAVQQVKTSAPVPPTDTVNEPSTDLAVIESQSALPAALAPRVVQGRLVVPPTQQQVLATALGRPGVRLSVFTHGLTHALRAESRDRILGMMRREYRRRRRERLQAGRRAARAANPSRPTDTWIGS
jgi:hypothetical protein